MEKKLDYTFFGNSYKHYFSQFKSFGVLNWLLAIIFFWTGFAWLIVLQVLVLVRQAFASLIFYINSYEGVYKIVITVITSLIIFLSHLMVAFLTIPIFFIGFFYDINNIVMSLGKTENLVVLLSTKK